VSLTIRRCYSISSRQGFSERPRPSHGISVVAL
jgi:hypothetical protein